MKELKNYYYRSGGHLLEIRKCASDKTLFHYYMDGSSLGDYETLEEAFTSIHSQTEWPPDSFLPPRSESDWTVGA